MPQPVTVIEAISYNLKNDWLFYGGVQGFAYVGRIEKIIFFDQIEEELIVADTPPKIGDVFYRLEHSRLPRWLRERLITVFGDEILSVFIHESEVHLIEEK